MLKIVSFNICPFVQRVTASLEAKKIPYKIEYINLSNKPDSFIEISPNGQVPLLIAENGVPLFESESIIEYIDDEYGLFDDSKSNESKALDRAWSYLGVKNYLKQCGAMRSKNEEIFNNKMETLKKDFSKVEDKLSKQDLYFSGDEISNVDIAWLPLLYRINLVKKNTCIDLLKGFPQMTIWMNNILSLAYIHNTISNDFEKTFNEFYLIDTYLGEKKRNCINKKCC